ncbi:MAG: SoxR reducing system RseC family protein [Clostridia bacterium]|nr:SoxR reducing system RseC family protein [Clostridia bacterium]
MRQIGIVTAVNEQKTTVAVRRMSACSGCHKANQGNRTEDAADVLHCHECAMFPTETEMTVCAVNEIGAAVGERVVIESATEMILGYAAAVFLMPIGLAFFFGCIFALVIDTAWSAYLGAVVGFVGAFAAVKLIFDRRAKEKTTYTIIKRLTKGYEPLHECQSLEN